MGLGALSATGLAALASLAAGGPQEASGDWASIWDRLAAAEALAADDPQRSSALETLGDLPQAEENGPRGRLLAAHVERLLGETFEFQLLPGEAAQWPFDGRESWLAARVLGPSPQRASAAQRALEATHGPLTGPQATLAWEIGVEEARALRLETARVIQAALHERYLAAWSASDLALTQSKLSDYTAADALLAGQIDRERAAGRPTAGLWATRGILALGSGDEPSARDYLGLGRVRGSADAGLVLARLDLTRGRLPEARAGFRALLLDPNPSPWAPRGWGLALLPRRSGALQPAGD